MKVVIIGRTEFLYHTISALEEMGHTILGIITAKAAPEYKIKETDFGALAQKRCIPFICCNNLKEKEVSQFLEKMQADIGVSVNWVSLVDQEMIQKFRYGILNAHFGDLPKYRGNACPNWAIINGEKEVTLSIHFMEGGQLDCGRVVVQDKIHLDEQTYIEDVYHWAEQVIPKAYQSALEKLEQNPDVLLKYADPKSEDSFRCYPRCPEDGLIDWEKSAVEIHRLIRASSKPFAGAFTYWCGKPLKIWRASLSQDGERYFAVPGQVSSINKEEGSIDVITGEGKLTLSSISYDEKEDIPPAKLIRSIRKRLG